MATAETAIIASKCKATAFAMVPKPLSDRYAEEAICPVIKDESGVCFEAPPSGVTTECGRRVKMEDNFAVQPKLIDTREISPNISLVTPTFMPSDAVRALRQPPSSKHKKPIRKTLREVLHYYGVFDGHGGPEAALHCRNRMHENFREAWNNLSSRARSISPNQTSPKRGALPFHYNQSITSFATTEAVVEVFKTAFRTTDEEFQSDDTPIIGTTAVVALVGRQNIFVGYCGDSRAVLCRDNVAYALTIDHKPDREDEVERIRMEGGQVLYFNGARVMGLLAMSRAIGDSSLKPYVTSEPDVCILKRSPGDQVLLLASDGLWDVINNQEACNIAMRCLKRAKEKGASPSEAARLTSAVLVKAAGTRGSRDNVTVVVVDLGSIDDCVSGVSSSENDHNDN